MYCSLTRLFSTGPTVTFNDEIESVKRESQKLKDMGVEIIIGLSHAGYRMDQLVAAEVPYIDVIVGGHSHTFLYNGKNLWNLFRITISVSEAC